MMEMLSRSEEIVLLTVLKLGDGAYGVAIRERILEDTGREWSFASIYTPLDKLARKDLVHRYYGEPSPERGGKRKRFYRVTPEGKKAIQAVFRFHEDVWSGVPELLSEVISDEA